MAQPGTRRSKRELTSARHKLADCARSPVRVKPQRYMYNVSTPPTYGVC